LKHNQFDNHREFKSFANKAVKRARQKLQEKNENDREKSEKERTNVGKQNMSMKNFHSLLLSRVLITFNSANSNHISNAQ